MKTPTLVNKVSFNDLISFFIRRSEHRFILADSVGRGQVQIFKLEEGLHTKFWDCCFKEGIEMYSDTSPETENTYFTLAFFLNMHGVRLGHKNIFLKKPNVWDTLFISDDCNYKVYIEPMARAHCLSIDFSKKWFEKSVTKGNDELKNLKEKICLTKPLLMFESMNQSENKLIYDLFNTSWENPLGPFYIKSSVLKIISDFFSKIRERQTLKLNNCCFDTINKVEEFLNNHLTNALPNLGNLAYQLSMSESTLRRRFKRRHGISMSAYFTHKKGSENNV